MATQDLGPLDGFNGKLGPIIGCKWKDQYVIKAKPRKRKDNPNQSQIEQRAKFAVIIAFLKRFAGVLRETIRDASMSGSNSALATIMDTAVTGTYPSFDLDYPKVILAKGSLIGVDDAIATAVNPGEIVFTWTNNTARDASATDKALIMCYCPELKRAAYEYDAAERSTSTATLSVPTAFSGKTVHTWMTFTSDKGVSDSAYSGSVTIL
jgi:hypothetical protein